MLRDVDKKVLEEIVENLKTVVYAENSYIIREGEPASHMLFVTQGIILIFKNGSKAKSLSKGSCYGDQLLLDWQFKSSSYSDLPSSSTNVKSLTKVEALSLNAVDLKRLLTKYWWHAPICENYHPDILEVIAVNANIVMAPSKKRKYLMRWLSQYSFFTDDCSQY